MSMDDNVIKFPTASSEAFLQFFFDEVCFQDECHYPFRLRVVCEDMHDGVYLSATNVIDLASQLLEALKKYQAYNQELS